ncbi:MAG: universal stress protein, partial [Pseudomonadota bacterium]
MAYKTILAVLPNAACATWLLPQAIALAEAQSAHLVAIHILQRFEMHPGGHGAINLDIYENLKADSRRIADECRAVFDAQSARTTAVTEWREMEAFLSGIPRKLVEQAFRADLVVMSAKDGWSHDEASTSTLHDVILGTGRPVLMLPEEAPAERIGRNVLLCWQPTREASMAAHNALPFLKGADLTTIL